ncbi:patatin-like phospholipase family protein [Acidovorax sp. GBBC 3334]|uniref:patatin-like phospholipase family protein n=1 Tax=Acidovorax sp. GBBC 3334 TaxID=2940496 RepID=UPI002304579B|nr:patatin-like phospholipase family protein [Acidovorax sp. GBBC 3334]MDA8457012.1 patatin-like phospholipase family protein [Acidovorax sp. GBBC 3334]
MFSGQGFSIHVDASGAAILKQPLKLHRLELTGGGAKGAVYPGAIKALQAHGQLDHLRQVGGASAGALVAAMLASGAQPDDLAETVNQLDMLGMMGKKARPPDAAPKPPPGKIGALVRMASNRGTEMPNLTNLLDRKVRESALQRIAASGLADTRADIRQIQAKLQARDRLDALESLERSGSLAGGAISELEALRHRQERHEAARAAIQRLIGHPGHDEERARLQAELDETACGDLTLGDLDCLGRDVPGIKGFFCTSTAVVSESGVPRPERQLAVFSSDNPDLRWMEVSHAARLSASLPGIVARGTQSLPHDTTDGSLKIQFEDGGVLMNTAALELIDPDAPKEESLVLTLEHPVFSKALGESSGPGSTGLWAKAVDKVRNSSESGRLNNASRQFAAERLAQEDLRPKTVMARLKDVPGVDNDYSGTKGTLALEMTPQERTMLQDAFFDRIDRHLQSRSADVSFRSLDHLLSALDGDRFAQIGGPEHTMVDGGPGFREAFEATAWMRASLAQAARDLVGADDAAPADALRHQIHGWARSVEAEAEGHPDRLDAWASLLTASPQRAHQRIMDLMRGQPSAGDGPFLRLCRDKDADQTARREGLRVAAQILYPAMGRTGITPAIRDLLGAAGRALAAASGRSDVQATALQLDEALRRDDLSRQDRQSLLRARLSLPDPA